ncbi:MAG: tetratricopeptide repeat protein, partial [Bacteroidetes bacterium]|nr:tetratricopeptide repeat protein [Bacteroidota bacterium]
MSAQPLHIDQRLSFDELVAEAQRLCDRRNKDAIEYINAAAAKSRYSTDLIEIATTRYLDAYYKTFVLNDYDGGIDIINELLRTLDWDDLQVMGHKLYMTLGNAYQFKGDVYEAQQTYLKGIRLLENKEETTASEKQFQASYYYNTALMLSASRYKMDMEEYLQKAIEINTALNSTFKLSKCYVLYGNFCEQAGKNTEAQEMFERALAIDIANNDQYSTAVVRANMGYVANNLQNYPAALEHFNTALSYFSQNQCLYEKGMTKMGIGDCYFKMGEHKKGIGMLYAAEKVFIEIDNKQELSNCCEKLAALLKDDHQYEKALAYMEKYNRLLREFFDTDKTNALTRAKKEFESEQKEKESQLLKQKNEEIQVYVSKLESSNNSLKQFANVASHDLREPVRMIHSYMSLLERTLGGNITEQQKDFLHFAIDGAKRMDNLIIDMLRLAKVDANPQIENVKLENIVEEIRLNLQVMMSEKNAMVTSGGLPEIKADRTQMLQLFQNLIANGLKYNESQTPMVKIKTVMGIEGFEITIADNGIGIPAQSRDKVFD